MSYRFSVRCIDFQNQTGQISKNLTSL